LLYYLKTMMLEDDNMNAEVVELKQRAEQGRYLYQIGEISQKEAKTRVMPYINAVNSKAKEIANKYNMRPKMVAFKSFVR